MQGQDEKNETKPDVSRPGQLALQLHPYYRGKIEVNPRCVVRDMNDFSIWYTPGVATLPHRRRHLHR